MARLPNRKKRLGILSWRRLALLGVLLVVAFIGYKAHRVWVLAHSLRAQLDDLQTVVDGSVDLGLREVGDSLRRAHADVGALRNEMAMFLPLTRFLGWVPRIGGDVRAAPVLLDVVYAVTQASVTAFDGLEPLVALTEGEDIDVPTLEYVLQALSSARRDFEVAQTDLATALERRIEIDRAALSYTAPLVAQMDQYLPLMQAALDGSRLVPDLLGASDQRAFLILAQNNDEMRATGGFISAAGVLVLEGGKIVEIVFEDSYALDDFSYPYPDSPPPILRYMGIDQWVFRDANWSPDFPTSAQKAIELYRISRELDVDGVLTVDQHALRAIVAALAPLEVEGWPEPVTDENVISLIQMAWSPSETEGSSAVSREWWQQRKQFVSDLFAAMQTKLETAPGQINWLTLARATYRVLEERHLQIWLTDPDHEAMNLLAEQGWDGAVRQGTSDFLLAVDTNMGYNKVNSVIQQSLDYRVLVSVDGRAQATLTIRHVHTGKGEGSCDHRPRYGADYDDLINRCYWDYLRVYVPAGSQLYAATAHPVPAEQLIIQQGQSGAVEILPDELGKGVFASFFVLPRGEETETRFVYQLPGATLEQTDEGWRYRLLVQKQAGTHGVPLRVTLALPPGADVRSVEPFDDAFAGSVAQEPEYNTVQFDVTLNTDQLFEVIFGFNDH